MVFDSPSFDSRLCEVKIQGTPIVSAICAEIKLCGKCAVFIPSPNVTGNHQYHNAKAVADRGGAFLIEEKDLTDQLLVSKLMELKNDPEKVKTMGQAAKKCAFNDSAETIYETIFK